VLLIKKLGGGVRPFINYKRVNNIIFKSQYLFLLIEETLDAIYYTKIFKKFNIIAAFNRI
ncbi:hypothetical protein NEUTE2DRAFT_54071, partial [Neurospora tetrasperma FGSC 2509]